MNREKVGQQNKLYLILCRGNLGLTVGSADGDKMYVSAKEHASRDTCGSMVLVRGVSRSVTSLDSNLLLSVVEKASGLLYNLQ